MLFASNRNQRRASFMLLIAAILITTLARSRPAAAHPLGNFSVNRYSHIVLTNDAIALTYIVDMAEIPALQIRPKIDTNNNDSISSSEAEAYAQSSIATLAKHLNLTLNGAPLPLNDQSHSLTFPEGQAGLSTQRLVVEFAPIPVTEQGELTFSDNNYADRLGWSEIVVDLADTLALTNPSLPTADISNRLLDYPEAQLQSPLKETALTATIVPAALALTNSTQSTLAAESSSAGFLNTDRFTELITIDILTPRVIAIALLIAFTLGGAHALTPGHGKTIVAAYLVGSRGTPKHALLLGLTTTITHTAGVFFFGLLVLFASQFILPEDLFPWLGVLSGLLVVFIGASLARAQFISRFGKTPNDGDRPVDYHSHLGVGHSHSIDDTHDVSIGSILALGVSGGILPCPSALVVLLSAIALQRVGFGLVLILVFSLGLATVLTLLGVLFVVAGNRLERVANSSGRLLHALPIASAIFVTLAGIGITLRALLETGVI